MKADPGTGQLFVFLVSIDSKGRKGKSVTLVEGFQHYPTTLAEIARILKQYCGAGGTVKEGNLEVQGDQPDRVAKKLRAMNHVVNSISGPRESRQFYRRSSGLRGPIFSKGILSNPGNSL